MVFILLGGFWALVGLVMLITGKASINNGFIILTGRKARIFGASTVVLGLVIVSISLLARTGWFEPGEITLGTFLVFFATVTALFMIISAVKLMRWARSGGGH